MSETCVGREGGGGTENARETNNECQNLTEEYFHGVCYFSKRTNVEEMVGVGVGVDGGWGGSAVFKDGHC